MSERSDIVVWVADKIGWELPPFGKATIHEFSDAMDAWVDRRIAERSFEIVQINEKNARIADAVRLLREV